MNCATFCRLYLALLVILLEAQLAGSTPSDSHRKLNISIMYNYSRSTHVGVLLDIYFTQMHTKTTRIKVTKNSIAKYKVLKTLHPGEIRTRDLLFRWRRR
jgi:hypothetical protein